MAIPPGIMPGYMGGMVFRGRILPYLAATCRFLTEILIDARKLAVFLK
jgi:hypothetical protein